MIIDLKLEWFSWEKSKPPKSNLLFWVRGLELEIRGYAGKQRQE